MSGAPTVPRLGTPYAECLRGRIMSDDSYSSFKLVIVVSQSNDGEHVRVCPWSANKGAWSSPQRRHTRYLYPIAYESLSSRQRSAVDKAIALVAKRGGDVAYKSGASHVGEAWLHPPKRNAPAPGVTKLVDPLASIDGAAQPRPKLQQLNRALSAWAFGGKRS